MICSVMVYLLLLYMLNTYSVLSTILVRLTMRDWIYLHVLQKCKFFRILLQKFYFMISLMKRVGNFLASDYETLMSPTTRDNRNCWWYWTVLSTILELQCVRLWILLMIFDGFELYFIRILRLLSYPVFEVKTSNGI